MLEGEVLMKSIIKNFSGIAIILFIILYLLNIELINSISYAISVSTLLYLLYDKLFWRYNPFDKTPRIYGEYSVKNKSTYQGGMEFDSYVFIKQTRSSIIVIDKMRDGVCESVTASLYKGNLNGKWFLYYTYLTHPKNEGDDMHYGTSILCIHNRDYIEGSYFTNRTQQTRGSQVLIRKK